MSVQVAKIIGGKVKNIAATTIGGSSYANLPVGTNSSGYVDVTLIDPSIGQDVFSAPAFEDLSAGDIVTLYSDAGTTKVRKADASNTAYSAIGYVKVSTLTVATATVYKYGTMSGLTGLTIGASVYLGTVGGHVTTPYESASNSGYISQQVGIASSATTLEFNPLDVYYL